VSNFVSQFGRSAPEIAWPHDMPATDNLVTPPRPDVTRASTTKPATPLCFVIDEDPRIRHFLSLILQGAGVDAVEYSDSMSFRVERLGRPGHVVFLNIGPDTKEANKTLVELGRARFAGVVQLMSSQGLVVLENLKKIGEQSNLRMLPVLKKPFEADAIKKILQSQNLGDRAAVAARVRLDDAIKNGWIETWYQPKINLRKKQLVGAEAFARMRHPEHGVLPPSAFMPGADEATLRALAEQTLVRALKAGLNFSQMGVNLRIAVNMNMDALAEVPVTKIVSTYRPQASGWAGLIIDVTEEQIVSNIEYASEIAKEFQKYNVMLAIDDFGRGVSSLMKVKDIPFAEMKLDRVFVTDCSADKVNASICKTVIDMAHSFGSLAVGIGVEKASDVTALVGMGCDLGQGYLLGQPMAEERFAALLKQRVASRASNSTGPAPQSKPR
jgi:EAL domain-containing protein (putative c-di-GMP-specific phosphodiesterase class I)